MLDLHASPCNLTCSHSSLHAHTRKHKHTKTHTHTHTHLHAYINMHKCIHARPLHRACLTCMLPMQPYMLTCSYIIMCYCEPQFFTATVLHIHAQHKHIDTHTHTYTLTCSPSGLHAYLQAYMHRTKWAPEFDPTR